MATKKKQKMPPVAQLDYKDGDLIIKEGDYGISVYEIIRGKVGIYVKSGEGDVSLAVLEPGEIFGEVTFLMGSSSPRTASARAIEDTTLAVLHPAVIAAEYRQMPPILKMVADQALKRLKQLNQKIGQFSIVPKPIEKKDKRGFYRKKLKLPCHYLPVGIHRKMKLYGTVRNISKSGMGLVISTSNAQKDSHNPGDKFNIQISISRDKSIRVTGEIVSSQRLENSSQIYLGIAFIRMSEDAQKQLGFFLMP